MPKIVLFHPVFGLTQGVRSLANRLTQALDPEKNFEVLTPDLFDGQTFAYGEEALAQKFLQDQRYSHFLQKAAAALPPDQDCTVAGFSFGGAIAQSLAARAPRIKACLLFHSALSPQQLKIEQWPDVHVQVHFSFADPWKKSADVSSLEAAVDASNGLFQYWAYPGKAHLFSMDDSPEYNAANTEKLLENTVDFLQQYASQQN